MENQENLKVDKIQDHLRCLAQDEYLYGQNRLSASPLRQFLEQQERKKETNKNEPKFASVSVP